MANFLAATTCNQPRLNDVKAARKVVQRYHFEGDVRAFISCNDEEFRLILSGSDWPAAYTIPFGEDPATFEPGYDLNPSGELENFLVELAPFLAESLTVQAVGFEGCRFPLCACQWHIEPNGNDIQVSEFSRCQTAVCCA